MSDVLTPARQEAVDALEAINIKAFSWVPEQVPTPAAIVGPDEPYLEPPQQGTPFRNFILNLQVLLIAGKGTNKAVTAAADDLIERAHAALSSDWDVTYVGAPGQVTLGGQTYLGVAMFIQRSVNI